MNKTELIAAVAQKSDLTKKDAEKAVKAVFEAISDSLTQDPGFQSWQTAQRFGQQQIRYDSEGPHEKRPFSFLANCRTIVV